MEKAILQKQAMEKRANPKYCGHAKAYMIDNGTLDLYVCEKYGCNCYHEPNGGPQFKKICDKN